MKTRFSNKVINLYTGTDQFYSSGTSKFSLPPGTYRLTVFKGPEYNVASQEVVIRANQITDTKVQLSRWINLPKQGWYSADSHLHIPRPTKELNRSLSQWMQAEDIHVANLLQWGGPRRFHNAIQYAHGPEGTYREGDYWLVSGQENPRVLFLGHHVILGARTPINYPDGYLIHKQFWEEARRQQGVCGPAHYGTRNEAQNAIAIDLLDNLLNMIEVLQFDDGLYQVWYDILNTGFRLAPIAGTDYPCGRNFLPGRERFYTKVDGALTVESWLEGIRRGRTFVTNGPMIEFRVDGRGPGDELTLKKPGRVRVEGAVRFDPSRDDVERLELVENGQVVRTFGRSGQAAEIRCDLEHDLTEAAWLALRASGSKRGEAPSPRQRPPRPTPSLAHSGAVYVSIDNAPPLSAHRRAKMLALAWIERLDDLEKRLALDRIDSLYKPGSDGVEPDYLRKHRAAFLERIQSAKQRFRELAR